MKPRITVITLGVDDLERSLEFYRNGLGLPTQGIVGKEFEHGAVAFFDLQAGLRLAIWNRKDIAHDAKVLQTSPSPTGFWLLFIMRCIWGIAWTFLRLGAYFVILDVSSQDNRGYYMGVYNGLYRLGSLVGMLLGGFLADFYGVTMVSFFLLSFHF
ncbi:MFS transporter [Laceyella putida]|jgi:MFS family permease|uniref:MFS transporter n=1 Tax=Laceyella putida TaxID=110101 RepID=A0ABW2RFH7_9BACL